MSKALVLGATALALFASAASTAMAQNGPPTGGQLPVAGGAGGGWYPGYGYGYGYGYAAPLYDYAAPAYGYAATAPIYNYAAPAYAAPATAGTTVIIVTQAPAYTAPPVASGYYNYAPGYWGATGAGVPGMGGAEDTFVRFAGALAKRGHGTTRLFRPPFLLSGHVVA
jgi:hypothetical protein